MEKLDEKIRKLVDFISEKNYVDEITKEQFLEIVAFYIPSFSEHKREKFVEKCLSLINNPYDSEDGIRAGFTTSFLIEQKQL